jgi:acetoacetyl-CoA reductase
LIDATAGEPRGGTSNRESERHGTDGTGDGRLARHRRGHLGGTEAGGLCRRGELCRQRRGGGEVHRRHRDRDLQVADYEACAAGIAKVEADLGPIDVLVNNAGITRDAMFHRMTPQQWREVIDTNLNGVFNMTHNVWNGMRERKFGRVVTISSINGQKGQMGQANYSAAKAGDLGFTKALAQEGAKAGITVNAICPGYIATDMVMAVPEKVREAIIAQIPVGRLGEAGEIARCVVFLASDEAGFITGSTITANGGQYFV